MTYNIALTKDEAIVESLPEVFLPFTHHDFRIVWNSETNRQDVVKGQNTYFGGSGEGQSFETWQDAIHTSLYDYFQYGEEFHEGDIFQVFFGGEVTRFKCEGFHVVRIS